MLGRLAAPPTRREHASGGCCASSSSLNRKPLRVEPAIWLVKVGWCFAARPSTTRLVGHEIQPQEPWYLYPKRPESNPDSAGQQHGRPLMAEFGRQIVQRRVTPNNLPQRTGEQRWFSARWCRQR